VAAISPPPPKELVFYQGMENSGKGASRKNHLGADRTPEKSLPPSKAIFGEKGAPKVRSAEEKARP